MAHSRRRGGDFDREGRRATHLAHGVLPLARAAARVVDQLLPTVLAQARRARRDGARDDGPAEAIEAHLLEERRVLGRRPGRAARRARARRCGRRPAEATDAAAARALAGAAARRAGAGRRRKAGRLDGAAEGLLDLDEAAVLGLQLVAVVLQRVLVTLQLPRRVGRLAPRTVQLLPHGRPRVTVVASLLLLDAVHVGCGVGLHRAGGTHHHTHAREHRAVVGLVAVRHRTRGVEVHLSHRLLDGRERARLGDARREGTERRA